MLQNILTGLSDLVYPPHCLVCRKHLTLPTPSREVLCPACRDGLVRNTPPFCPKCSRHLVSVENSHCAQCRKQPPAFDFAWSACLYKDPLRDLVIRFKYIQRTYLRKLFNQCLKDFLQTYRLDIQQFDYIVPIPLHNARHRERGYNQAQLLAEPLAKDYGIPFSANNLIRCRNTKQQTLLSEKERWTNIRGAFRINHPVMFRDKNVLLIDDLITTGATASEAATALKKAGAGTVGVLTLAITAK